MAINFTKGMSSSIPTDDTDMATALSGAELTALQTDDNSYVEQQGSTTDNAIMLFKESFLSDTTTVTKTWTGKSSVAPITYPVYLQVYNRNLSVWETLDFNGVMDADTEFTLTGTISSNIAYYWDENRYISFRIMQSIDKESSVWTFAFIPDTQYMLQTRTDSLNFRGSRQWEDLADYLVSVKDAKNIQFALHNGDYVQQNSFAGCQEGFSWGATGFNTLINDDYPILFGVGAHDYDYNMGYNTGRGITIMESYVTKAKYDTYSWFGGSTYPAGHMNNTYAVKTINGEKWLLFAFEMFPPRAVLTWADGVIAAEAPDYIILGASFILNPASELVDWTNEPNYGPQMQGQTIYEGESNVASGEVIFDDFIVNHPEIVLVMGAHTIDDTRAGTNDGGNVHAKMVYTHPNGNICTIFGINYQEEPLYKKPWESGKNYVAYSLHQYQDLVEVSASNASGKTMEWNYYYRCKLSHTSSSINRPETGANWSTYWDKIAWTGCGLIGTVVFFEINSDTRTITRYEYHPISGISPENYPKDNYPTEEPDWYTLHHYTFKY